MNRSIFKKIKGVCLLCVSAGVVIFGYIINADNKRSENRQFSQGEIDPPAGSNYSTFLETDLPEITSGTQ